MSEQTARYDTGACLKWLQRVHLEDACTSFETSESNHDSVQIDGATDLDTGCPPHTYEQWAEEITKQGLPFVSITGTSVIEHGEVLLLLDNLRHEQRYLTKAGSSELLG